MATMNWDITAFISQSLSPAITISGIGLLASSLNNRLPVISGRIRELDRIIRLVNSDPEEVENAFQQISYFMRRIRMVRNALLLLFAAIGMMVFTAISIAMTQLGILSSSVHFPFLSFVFGLILVLVAVSMEAYEISLNLKSLKLDVAFTRIQYHRRAKAREEKKLVDSANLQAGNPKQTPVE